MRNTTTFLRISRSFIIRLFTIGTLSLLSGLIIAQVQVQDSPAGLWKTIDDKTGKAKSLIRITETNGELTGKIEKLFREPDQESNPKCKECEGANKDQPIIGMTILYGLKKEDAQYAGGHILDPANGKVYKSKLKVMEGGKKLEVRGFIGFSLLGRTQTWLREE